MPTLIARRDLLFMASSALAGLAGGRLHGGFPKALVGYANSSDWSPTFFSAPQDETVIALTDLIIPRTDTPGAKDANVHRYLDLFLSIKDPAEQRQFADGLARLDELAKRTYKHEFVHCAEADQISLLNSIASSSFFSQAKTLTSAVYFSTPEGYKDLNKFGLPQGIVAGTLAHV